MALGVATTLLLAGCSSGDDDPEADVETSGGASASEPTSATAEAYLPVPEGVELTEPGSELEVGDTAVVAYRPRQNQVGALDIRITRLEQTSIKQSFTAWQLSPAGEKSTPYFVHARIENVGDTDLGGRPVPLYVVNEDDVLLESTPFASTFAPCPSKPFPKRFGPGAKTNACLVYMAPDHGELVAVSFRPEETFNPITWTGEVERYVPPKPEKRKKGNGKG